MYAVGTYEEVEKIEKSVENQELVVLMFIRPSGGTADEILRDFEYMHYNSDGYCSIYAVGYSNDPQKVEENGYKSVGNLIDGQEWFFSSKVFADFKKKLEKRIKWKYSGEIELLLLQNKPDGNNSALNFNNYVSLNINKGLREGYIDSFAIFMEELVRAATSKESAANVADEIELKRINIKDIICESINEAQKIPKPIKKIITDRLFYRPANYKEK